MSLRDIPNLISLLRILLVIPVVLALLDERYVLALILSAIAGISDGIDGFLAKHFHWQSRLGSILDPIADKLLLVASFATLAWTGLIPMWLLWLVLARDIIIVCGGLIYHYTIGEFELLPLWSSKINTALQILLVLLVIIEQQWLPMLHPAVTVGIWAVVASVLYSGFEYVIIWGNKAWKQRKRPS
ncbi:CDP-alcohol phosphatidyltransferase family protein [Methylophaga sulfidovorans]|uniref:CDP-diacylglycerol--glycerol-3-phosphate 3-phosphatidyltransferase n=1 Tax=Methylophaga sulfidovorans TaxID=45496 RepID=A0A1I3ZLR3_9GAMM|nr:CDP-alcohol phosphatidyltransferase family protein [Methylophaga sulfidovorans]SFK44992.1 CDP-diacylglycerol--glycerol-3-phosphate 3-phosphatidyltransferase [Methylophaga sulfidovorans]